MDEDYMVIDGVEYRCDLNDPYSFPSLEDWELACADFNRLEAGLEKYEDSLKEKQS